MNNQAVIRLKNATFYAYHGVISDEQNLGGRFEVDLDLYADLTAAEQSDSLQHTVDYERVYSVLRQLVVEKKYYLIEALGSAIANRILMEFPVVGRVVVRVRKPHPPVKGVVDSVEVEITENRL
jgi:dihydroneopterin aldolase